MTVLHLGSPQFSHGFALRQISQVLRPIRTTAFRQPGRLQDRCLKLLDTTPAPGTLVHANCPVDLCVGYAEFRRGLTYLVPRRFVDGDPGVGALLSR